MIVCYDKNMKANQFRIVSVSVAVKAEDAERVAQELNDAASNFGFHVMGTSTKVPNRIEWEEIKDDSSSNLLDDEQQRRDEKHGLYGGKVDDAN